MPVKDTWSVDNTQSVSSVHFSCRFSTFDIYQHQMLQSYTALVTNCHLDCEDSVWMVDNLHKHPRPKLISVQFYCQSTHVEVLKRLMHWINAQLFKKCIDFICFVHVEMIYIFESSKFSAQLFQYEGDKIVKYCFSSANKDQLLHIF